MDREEWNNIYDDARIESFLRVDGDIVDIILLGEDGGIRRVSRDFEYGDETK